MIGTDISLPALTRLRAEWDALTPEAQKAARYVLENPQDIGVSTVREVATAARVKPNTLVRMARQIGFEGYEDFRAPFREAIRRGGAGFTDRVRWLQQVQRSDAMGKLYGALASAALDNIERSFAQIDTAQLAAAARTIWQSRSTLALGVGVNEGHARNFTYLASTGMLQFKALPGPGSTITDDLAWADSQDVLLTMTCKPYRREVVEAVSMAREQGLKIIGISDSPASPIVLGADHGFVVATDGPQFFPSSVAVVALLETLLSFVIAVASDTVAARVETFHNRRHEFGLYMEDRE